MCVPSCVPPPLLSCGAVRLLWLHFSAPLQACQYPISAIYRELIFRSRMIWSAPKKAVLGKPKRLENYERRLNLQAGLKLKPRFIASESQTQAEGHSVLGLYLASCGPTLTRRLWTARLYTRSHTHATHTRTYAREHTRTRTYTRTRAPTRTHAHASKGSSPEG